MVARIYNCFISLLCAFLLGIGPVRAQYSGGQDTRPVATKKEKKPAEIEYPWFNGVSVGVDLYGLGAGVFGSDFLSSGVVVDVDLKHRFFPTVELGYGTTDSWNNDGIHYKSSAPYFRVGLDYNALYKKKHGQMILVGVRYGYSSFSYDVNTLPLTDPIFGESLDNPLVTDGIWGGTIPYDYSGQKGTMQWLEFCAGIRAHVWKPIWMGLGLRFRVKMSESKSPYGDPWYVPGFGKYGSNSIGVQYTLIYKLPF